MKKMNVIVGSVAFAALVSVAGPVQANNPDWTNPYAKAKAEAAAEAAARAQLAKDAWYTKEERLHAGNWNAWIAGQRAIWKANDRERAYKSAQENARRIAATVRDEAIAARNAARERHTMNQRYGEDRSKDSYSSDWHGDPAPYNNHGNSAAGAWKYYTGQPRDADVNAYLNNYGTAMVGASLGGGTLKRTLSR